MGVKELRLVVTVDDYDAAVAFYRDALGMPERESYTTGDAEVMILEAGKATLEIANRAQAEYIDDVEVGRRVAGKFRVALEVDDSAETTTRLAAAGAEVIAEPTRTPWNSLNARLETPGGVQLTLFTELDLK
ncbi:VOC family protein [Kribbella sp. NPDC003557]|uniref:VOC family protein n=1 Tax=Kribbella sp. NPDC003557 TaxID=3154449 RepID=UPI0033BA891D